MLSKKPLGGNHCASCEAYLGDLHEDNTFIPWNQYPTRDNHDRDHKVNYSFITIQLGKGFSKMVQMINLDQAGFSNNMPGSTGNLNIR